jgi:3-hydroxyisobutyrate dehydrogenase-like beta-hydroxyacid dehydrogenase
MKEQIGLIGIGLVGTALAENLLGNGFSVVGYDIDPARCAALEKIGGISVSTPMEISERVNRVILSLMTTEIVCEVLWGQAGLLQSKATPDYIIDTTTGDPDATVEIALQLKKQEILYLDSPISGSSAQIQKRKGVVIVGGDPHAFELCQDLYQAIAEEFVHVGPSGSGSRAKLVSNVILGLNRLVLAEGLVYAERFGFDLDALLVLLKKTPAYSCAMDVKGEKMIRGDFSPQSRIRQHFKDLEIALSYAKKLKQPLPLTQLHRNILKEAIEAGDGDLDNAAVIQQIRRIAKRDRNK